MKKQRFTFCTTLALILLTGCATSPKNSVKDTANQLMQELTSPSRILTDSILPKHVELKQDITPLSYQELRLLRSYPYALHGYWFREGDLNAFFSRRTDWYYDLCDSLCDEEKSPETYEDVHLSREEADFVRRIDHRMRELEHNGSTPPLQNPRLCVNLFQMEKPDQDFANKLTAYNFAIADGSYEQLFQVYEKNDYLMMPSFITTDLYLQAAHMYFGYVLKYLEHYTFVPVLTRLTEALYAESMRLADDSTQDATTREKAEYNAAFFAIAAHLLTGKDYPVSNRYRESYTTELANINRMKDSPSEFLDYVEAHFPYSLFKPRGHYNRNENTRRYFRAMMWMQAASFCRDNREQLSRTIFMALTFNRLSEEQQKETRGMFDALTYLMGQPDNLSVTEIADRLKEQHISSPADADNPAVMSDINHWLEKAFKTRNRIKPQVEITCTDKINFMPQRYLPDNEVLNRMADPTPGAARAFPRGLDVMAAFGSEAATHILDTCYRDAELWKDYVSTAREMKSTVGDSLDANASMYNKWLATLIALQQEDKSTPAFMQTPAWQCKNLNTALASWAELKHDAILYGEQPIMAECGDGSCLPIPIVVGYVEPNLPFWNGLKEMLQVNRTLLERTGLLDQTLRGKSEALEEKVNFCLRVSEKELRGEAPTEEEYMTIQKMGSSMEWFTLSVIDPEHDLDRWELVQGADRSIALAADVFTRNVLGCNKNGILHEGTGLADVIYVLVNIGGTNYLTSGATLRYYEFVRPLGERLTDEEWQQMLKDNRAPQTPEWMHPFRLKQKPNHNETFLYSTGC